MAPMMASPGDMVPITFNGQPAGNLSREAAQALREVLDDHNAEWASDGCGFKIGEAGGPEGRI